MENEEKEERMKNKKEEIRKTVEKFTKLSPGKLRQKATHDKCHF